MLTLPGGWTVQSIQQPSQARIKEEGWHQEGHPAIQIRSNKSAKNSYIASHENARASPDQIDAFHHLLSGATSGRRLPPARRRQLRKLADTKVRMKGTATGQSRELADTMTRRNIDIACTQETRWKGAKTREIGEGYKIVYNGCNT